jgi:hypothetical protein
LSFYFSFHLNLLYNVVMIAVMITSHHNSILLVRQLQLTSYVHSAQALRVLVLVKRDVEFLRDCITFIQIDIQIDIHKSSYLNVILIQSRERTLRLSCLVCRSERSSLRSFSECRRVVEHFDEACVNCK